MKVQKLVYFPKRVQDSNYICAKLKNLELFLKWYGVFIKKERLLTVLILHITYNNHINE